MTVLLEYILLTALLEYRYLDLLQIQVAEKWPDRPDRGLWPC